MAQTIPIKVWNRIEMLKQPIMAVAPPTASNRKRWIAICYDVNRHSVVAMPPHLYCVVDTEFDAALLDVHAEYGDGDLAIVSQAKYFVTDTNELYALLNTLQVDPGSFDAPWHVDHPLF
jgi:hypothetical protein